MGVALGVRLTKLKPTDLYIHRPTSFKLLLVWCFAFLVYIFITEVVLYRLGLLGSNPWMDSFWPSLIKLVGMVVLAPIAEELFFRGVLLSRLRHWQVNKHLAILIQASIFVLFHSAAFSMSWQASIGKVQIFTDAVLFGYALYVTQSIYTPMVMHATGNAIAALEQFIL
ncbi:hypothetical protein GCM10023189_50540 [Nibrella saemangeumensis]|uniref:CAAX prenyl protease 2/Lysostaphin resistance protein A-like domain-containing protein n=2 Tax=Nibrella saemangeumensis TaxID=1084526 RepID=A0ABP8NL94_9BACT